MNLSLSVQIVDIDQACLIRHVLRSDQLVCRLVYVLYVQFALAPTLEKCCGPIGRHMTPTGFDLLFAEYFISFLNLNGLLSLLFRTATAEALPISMVILPAQLLVELSAGEVDDDEDVDGEGEVESPVDPGADRTLVL